MPTSGSWRNSSMAVFGPPELEPSASGLHRKSLLRPLANARSRIPNYELAEAAEADLKSIAYYTISKWGAKQAARYGAALDAHFEAIGKSKARTRAFLLHRPELRVSRVEHHYVFHLDRENQCPLILAVFHEHMDLMAKLQVRLQV